MNSVITVVLVFAGCGGSTSYDPPSSSKFVGTWLCGPGVPPLTIRAAGNGLTESFTTTTPAGALTCTEVFSVSGSTATLIPSQTTCAGPAATNVTGTPSSETETVNGNTMILTGADLGSAPMTVTCTRQ
jgi:hypothetical protein